MLEIVQSDEFARWFKKLRDRQAKARIEARIRRMSMGNPGDSKPLRNAPNISEMRIDYGPGYRVYYMQRGAVLIVLLCGGDKRTQDKDIKDAIGIAKDWRG
jgi:putative addiction module killer protein